MASLNSRRPRRHDRARAATPSCRSTPTATAGATSRGIPLLGWSYVAWQKIWRLAGADHMHVNGLRNKFCEPDDSVIALGARLLTPMFADKPCTVMPVFSSGQTAAQVPDTYARARLDRPDLRRRRRHHGPPDGAGGRRRGAARRLGRGDRRRRRSRPCPRPSPAGRGSLEAARSDTAALPGACVAFYGDDFTGSAAVMEVLTFAGLADGAVPRPADREPARAVSAKRGHRHRRRRPLAEPGLDGARAAADLSSARRARRADPHYKVCSTFDSRPTIGSIGRAIELGLPILGGAGCPLVVAAPAIGRYQAFGNLFAAVDGIGYRLDRHPTMAAIR